MFLKEISNEIIRSHGSNLARIAVIFPNKRASLWMNDYLLEAANGKPVFAPQYFSISDFFQKHSDLVLADHIQLVSILHKSYCKITGDNQTHDKFYPWGEILLSDFDNVDKSLADPADLFRNISNIHEYDTIKYLKKEQLALLEHFFQSFTRNHESQLQQKFIALWNNLLNIFNDFKATLSKNGIAYEGMLYREVAENINDEDFKFEHYYAIGFNKLLKCEEKLFKTLSGKLTQKDDKATVDDVSKDAQITIAQALTDDLQTRYIETWLKENNRIAAGRRTAIVLCDEHLLPSAIYGFPDNVSVNITAGFPLSETHPASYIATLLELYTEGLSKDRTHFRAAYLRNLEGHPLHKFTAATAATVPEASPSAKSATVPEVSASGSTLSILTALESAITTIAINVRNEELQHKKQADSKGLLPEAIFRIYNIITRLKSLHEQGFLDIAPITLARLYKQIILTTTIPYHGEPAKGIQIMGVLETRNLDFDHILMLSCNEGAMPQGGSDSSAIPYNLKKAFGLSTSDERTDIFAYYFYRMLKRCNDITLVYNASGSDTSPGEMSRFLLNLIVNRHQQIKRISLQAEFQSHTKLPHPHEITPEELRSFIESKQRGFISPSAINKYMNCEKQFYYQYYRNLREEKDEEEEMDAAAFGIFFHHAAEDFYQQFVGATVSKGCLQHYIDKPELLEPHINRALAKTREEMFGKDAMIDSGGMEHLLKSITRSNLRRMLKNDIKSCPFSIINLESQYFKNYTVATAIGNISVRTGGAVDRLDCIKTDDGTPVLRVVDYKTGPDHSDIGKAPSRSTEKENTTRILSVADIFNNKIDGSSHYRQTCLYSIALAEDERNNPHHIAVAPALYYIRNKDIGTDNLYNPIIKISDNPINDINTIKEEYENELAKVLHSIFNKLTFNIPANLTTCKNCPYAELCME